MFNETDAIKSLKKLFSSASGDLKIGIGDDCAAIKKGENKLLLISTDTVMENVHFSKADFLPGEIAEKSVSVSVSDIASMGGKPKFILSTIGLPKCTESEFMDELLDGLNRSCNFYGIELIGGNMTTSERLFLDITVLGEIEEEKVVKRSGALAGHLIYVTGTLGDSALGLSILKSHKHKSPDSDKYINTVIERHKKPMARVEIGEKLSEMGLASAMIDISDGLIIDLERITLESDLGAKIEVENIPLSESYRQLIGEFEDDIYKLALTGGEDYELLFTSPPELKDSVTALYENGDIGITEIGVVTENSDIEIRNSTGQKIEYENRGFVHFSQ